MSIFKNRRKEFGGLFIDKGMFRFISLTGSEGEIAVRHVSFGVIPDIHAGSDPFADYGAGIENAFSYVLSKIGKLNMPIAISIPTTESLLRIVTLPDMEITEAKMAFKYDFENYFPFTTETAVYDIAPIVYPLPDGAEEKRYIAVASRRRLIEKIMYAAEEQNIEIAVIEPAQIALERAVTPIVVPVDAAVYLYAGRENSVMILSWKGNGVFYRTLTDGFVEKTDSSDLQTVPYNSTQFSFVKQVYSSLQFAVSQMHGFNVDSVYLYGPGSSQDLCDLLKNTLNVATVLMTDPLRIHGIKLNASDNEAGMWEIPIGLALRYI